MLLDRKIDFHLWYFFIFHFFVFRHLAFCTFWQFESWRSLDHYGRLDISVIWPFRSFCHYGHLDITVIWPFRSLRSLDHYVHLAITVICPLRSFGHYGHLAFHCVLHKGGGSAWCKCNACATPCSRSKMPSSKREKERKKESSSVIVPDHKSANSWIK